MSIQQSTLSSQPKRLTAKDAKGATGKEGANPKPFSIPLCDLCARCGESALAEC
jgi:hypothetical protein